MDIPWEMLIERLEGLGTAITGTVQSGIEALWPMAVRQVMVEGWLWILGGVLLILSAICLFVLLVTKSDYIKQHSLEVGIVMGILFSISLGIPSIGRGINYLCNPTWHAVHKIIEMF